MPAIVRGIMALMEHFTRDQCRALDAAAIARGIPSLLLMEHAALGASAVAARMLGAVPGKHIWIVCGPGNNGGDGYAMARVLHNAGAHINLWELVAPGRIDPASDPGVNRSSLAALAVEPTPAWDTLPPVPEHVDLVVDAIFGTGLSRAPEGRFASAIEAINRVGAPVLAVDIPSGLDADSGHALGTTVRAHATATFGVPKVGFRVSVAQPYVGELYCCPIGVPRDLLPEGIPNFGVHPVPVT